MRFWRRGFVVGIGSGSGFGAAGATCGGSWGRAVVGSTDPAVTDSGKFQLEAGIPTVPSFGAGVISVCHGPNEWVGVESIVQASKIYALAAYDVLRP